MEGIDAASTSEDRGRALRSGLTGREEEVKEASGVAGAETTITMIIRRRRAEQDDD